MKLDAVNLRLVAIAVKLAVDQNRALVLESSLEATGHSKHFAGVVVKVEHWHFATGETDVCDNFLCPRCKTSAIDV